MNLTDMIKLAKQQDNHLALDVASHLLEKMAERDKENWENGYNKATVDHSLGENSVLENIIQKSAQNMDKSYNVGFKDGYKEGYAKGYGEGWDDAIDTKWNVNTENK